MEKSKHYKKHRIEENPSTLKKLQAQPIYYTTWVHRDELSPNLYNPNRMAPPEMELLVASLKSDGWLFPICVLPKNIHVEGLTENAEKDKYTIIDGFHRYMTSGKPEVYALTDGMVPIVIPAGDDHIATTVRMNRIKGTHTVIGMADIILHLLKRGKTIDYIMEQYGMEKEEVIRLANQKGIPKSDVITQGDWSKAWKPGEHAS